VGGFIALFPIQLFNWELELGNTGSDEWNINVFLNIRHFPQKGGNVIR